MSFFSFPFFFGVQQKPFFFQKKKNLFSLTFSLVVTQVRHLPVDQDPRLPLVAPIRGADAHEPRRPRPRAEAPARGPGALALERGLHLLARLAHEVRHGRVGVLGQREVGRAVGRVAAQEADGGAVVRPRCRLFRFVVPHRDPGFPQARHLDLHAPLALLLVEGDAAEAGLEGAVGRARGAGSGGGGRERRSRVVLDEAARSGSSRRRRSRARSRERGGGRVRRGRCCRCCGRGRRDAAAVGELGLGRHFLFSGGERKRKAEVEKKRVEKEKSCCRKACGREGGDGRERFLVRVGSTIRIRGHLFRSALPLKSSFRAFSDLGAWKHSHRRRARRASASLNLRPFFSFFPGRREDARRPLLLKKRKKNSRAFPPSR